MAFLTPYYYLQVKGVALTDWWPRMYLVRFKVADRKTAPIATTGLTITRDVPYYDGPGQNSKHKLDIFRPPNANASTPVMVFVHGGGWVCGDRRDVFDVHENVCVSLALKGITTVNISYRLAGALTVATPAQLAAEANRPSGSPSLLSTITGDSGASYAVLRHPAQAQDVVAAVGWVHRNISQHGGSPDKIFVGGHDSGGHLASLVAVNPSFVQYEKLPANVIKGVISISGIYDLLDFSRTGMAQTKMVTPAFSSYKEILLSASPLYHVLPPDAGGPASRPVVPWKPRVLLAIGELEEGLARQCNNFGRALEQSGWRAERHVVAGADHFAILARVGTPEDTLIDRIVAFIQATTSTPAQ